MSDPDAAAGDTRDRVRVAGVDMGSNTTRLIVADVWRRPDGTLAHDVLEHRSTTTRLAEGVDARGILLPVPITRVRSALVEYRAVARELGCAFVLATATSAVRDADNGEAFLGEVEHGFGFRAELLDGEAEARASWSGATSDPELARRAGEGSGLLVDIGGGSTEVVLAERGEIVDHHSFQLGAVRLTERHLDASDPPGADELAAARAAALEELRERFPEPRQPALAVGVAGTVTTVVGIRLGLATHDPDAVHLQELTPAEVDATIERLAQLTADERTEVDGLSPGRAPVILGGLVVLAAVMEHWEIGRMLASERDILDGIALMAGRIALEEGIEEMPEPFGRTIC